MECLKGEWSAVSLALEKENKNHENEIHKKEIGLNALIDMHHSHFRKSIIMK